MDPLHMPHMLSSCLAAVILAIATLALDQAKHAPPLVKAEPLRRASTSAMPRTRERTRALTTRGPAIPTTLPLPSKFHC